MQRASAKVVVKALGAVAEKDIARFPMLSGHSCGVVPRRGRLVRSGAGPADEVAFPLTLMHSGSMFGTDTRCAALRYVYRGLETGEQSTQLFKWHASLTEKAGMGCIMRALSEKQRV
eukprot:1136361-Rhodomonas_salina.2